MNNKIPSGGMVFPGGAGCKESAANAGDARDMGFTPGSRRSPEGGNNNVFYCSYLGNPMYRRPWQCTVRGAAELDMTE